MLITIPILVDLCPHLVAFKAVVHENLSVGLQTSKYYTYVDFELNQSMMHHCYLDGSIQQSVKFLYVFHGE